jgi:hypothetical protein
VIKGFHNPERVKVLIRINNRPNLYLALNNLRGNPMVEQIGFLIGGKTVKLREVTARIITFGTGEKIAERFNASKTGVNKI